MLSIVEFLNARSDELAGHAKVVDEPDLQWLADYGDDVGFPRAATFIRAVAPPSVLADVEAKRQLLGLHKVGRFGECVVCDVGAQSCGCCGYGDFPCDTVRVLALPHANHPDYRSEWRLEV